MLVTVFNRESEAKWTNPIYVDFEKSAAEMFLKKNSWLVSFSENM